MKAPAKFSWGQRVRIVSLDQSWKNIGCDYTGYAARIEDHARGCGHEYSLRIYKGGKCINKIAWIPEDCLEAR